MQETIEQAEARVRAEMQKQFQEQETKYQSELQAVLGNKDQILEEKKAVESKFKGMTDDKIKSFEEYQKRLETDEEMRLISEGKFDEVINRRMQGREKAISEERSEMEERFKAAQTSADELKAALEESNNKNLTMRKRQYAKDLTGSDDSFKGDYFNDYFALQSNNMDFDEETGAVYALENGKRKVDTNGDFVKYEDEYNKQKTNHGLFWNAGSGSGMRQGAGGEVVGNDPSKWSKEQKFKYIGEHGQKSYAEMLSKASK